MSINNNRGRKSQYTDEELKLIALDVKFKNNQVKLTPSLLERETSIGRNTWSRRIPEYIAELNRPLLKSRSLNVDEDIALPNIDIVYEKFKQKPEQLKMELISFEQILYDTYSELLDLKKKESKFNNLLTKYEKLELELKKQSNRAAHFEQLYNELVVSSSFIHLVENPKSKVYKFSKKHLDINSDLESNLSLENLTSFFPDTNKTLNTDETKKKENFKKLQDEFNL
ncbi:hypothetical protein ACIP9G_02690 [Lysinibacillus sp. NPDC093197]|uniref:hypothetical protein n=1 Tax=Lysinibacillus sp. NPDC093197 TaxID=3364132 RepID=UPI0037FE6486